MVAALMFALGFRGEPSDWSVGRTWLALGYLIGISAILSLLPGALLGLLFSVAVFKGDHAKEIARLTRHSSGTPPAPADL